MELHWKANGIEDPHNLQIGQEIWIPRTYQIKKGDTLYSISKHYGVSIEAMQRANGIEDPNLIHEGGLKWGSTWLLVSFTSTSNTSSLFSQKSESSLLVPSDVLLPSEWNSATTSSSSSEASPMIPFPVNVGSSLGLCLLVDGCGSAEGEFASVPCSCTSTGCWCPLVNYWN